MLLGRVSGETIPQFHKRHGSVSLLNQVCVSSESVANLQMCSLGSAPGAITSTRLPDCVPSLPLKNKDYECFSSDSARCPFSITIYLRSQKATPGKSR